MTDLYRIRPATPADLPMLGRWRAQPHVVRWWGEPDVEPLADSLADPRIALSVVETPAGRPFALVQHYDVADWLPHHFAHLPRPAVGLDLFIGEPDLLHAGHGPRLLRQHVDALFAGGIGAAGLDPHPDNTAAQRAFARAGFEITSGPMDTRWGRAVLMERRRSEPAG